MKILIGAIALMMCFSQISFADQGQALFEQAAVDMLDPDCSLVADCDDDEDPWWQMCTARDSRGKAYNYYAHVAHPVSYVQRKAVEKCRSSSNRPASCRPAGCREVRN